jgi:pimeloyl-ACP methyl ester carboxylesterase
MSEPPVIRFLMTGTGARVAYATQGRGPVLVCPAWWVSHVERDVAYPPFRRFFTRLAEHATVVRYDRPGSGLSDPAEDGHCLESEAALLGAMVDELGVSRVSLFAVSSGAPPAIAFAASRPEHVERLVLYGAYATGAELASEATRAALTAMVRAHWGLGARMLADLFVPDADRPALDALGEWQRSVCDGNAAADLLQLTYGMDVADRLDAIRTPTLVLHRREDRAVPFATGREIAARIPGARFVPLEGRAHPPWEGSPDVGTELIRFLAGSATLAAVEAPACRLDAENCELVVGQARVPLTRLELGTLRYLEERPSRVIGRPELIQHVWGQRDTGSNVVEVVIRSLRGKLGPYRASIETVTGHGYRFRGWSREG